MKGWILMVCFVAAACGPNERGNGGTTDTQDASVTCMSGRVSCNGSCVNTATDGENCGGCGNACPQGMGCVMGTCASGCAAPNTTCSGACVDPQSSPRHCGGCGNACGDGQSCVNGACACAAGQALCDGRCVNTSTDPLHCGGCTTACGTGQVCMSGACVRSSMRDCTGRECGSDGAGGSCGTCPIAGWGCNVAGRCVPPDMTCRSGCTGRECGPDPGMFCEGRTCGSCAGSSVCNASGRCACVRNCTGRECGSDGCGGSCGTCAVGRTCSAAGRCEGSGECVSACAGRMCGVDPGLNCGSRTCGTCPSGFTCNSAGTACNVSATSRWVVTAVRGAAARTPPAGGSWDIDGSAPDPYFCLTLNGAQSCTEFVTDTFAPTWRMGLFPATTAAALMSGVPSAYLDDDVGPDDNICAPGTISFTAAQFSAGAPLTFTCGATGSFTLTLTPAP